MYAQERSNSRRRTSLYLNFYQYVLQSNLPLSLSPLTSTLLFSFQERLRAIKIPALGVAGRLDKDVTGVVIMSTDGQSNLLHTYLQLPSSHLSFPPPSGDLVQRIITPKKKVMGKVYEVEAMLPFTEQEKASIESGGLMLR